MNRPKTIPTLRFPEFEGELPLYKLSELSTRISDGIHSTPNYDEDGEYFFINGNNLIENGIAITPTTKKVNDVEFKKHRKDLGSNTILLSINGTIGNIAFYNNEPVILGKSACYINLKPEANTAFIFYLLQTERIKRFFDDELTGSTIKNLSLGTIKETEIFAPPLPEQQKIASFLTTVDEKIQQLSRKKARLEQYKKGVMQQLFSREVRFRPENGEDYPEWEERTLGEVGTFINGRAYKDLELLDSGKYPVLRVGNFFTNSNWYYSDLELEESKFCLNGDLLYAWSASFGPRIWEGGKTIFHYHIWKVEVKEKIDKRFLFYVLDFETAQLKASSSNGFALLHITKGTIEKWKCWIPALPEQQKIASFLSALDEKIGQVGQQLEQAKGWKKGLLQWMFV